MRHRILLATVTSLIVSATLSAALEGKWSPLQLSQLDRTWLAAEGLNIAPEAVWNQAASEGLLAAVVDLDGCSGALVSSDGLVATNHHCVMPILQQLARPEADLIQAGFLATDRSAELPALSTKALVPVRFSDVTATVVAAGEGQTDDRVRAHAIERAQKQLVAACEQTAGRRCQVAVFDGGLRYVLVESLEFPDVRLVFAPPRAIGDFGGEVDNWMWPRHTGDFAFLRIWTDADGGPARPGKGSQPLRPRQHLRLGLSGVGPGDFVMVAGYPARSYRFLTAAEMGERAALYYPQRSELFSSWLTIMQLAAEKDEDARLALADRITSLANDEKNARAEVAGLARYNFVEQKWAFEHRVLEWARARADQKDAVAAYQALDAAVAERRQMWRHDFLLESMWHGPLPVAQALRLVRWARERGKPDMDRLPEFMERNRDRLKETFQQEERQIHLQTEKALLVALFERLAEQPEGARSKAVERRLSGARDREDIAGRVDFLFASSRVADGPSQRDMFDENLAKLRLRRDPLLEFAFAVEEELREIEARREQWEGASWQLRQCWLKAVHAFVGRPVAPDANGTLRVSFGHVMGYTPHDAVVMMPQTRLAGMIEKVTGHEPFAVPDTVRVAAAQAAKTPWIDPRLSDVPVAFLADLDTTGGNSGSPVLNSRGELVGLNYDRVWENVANDFGYSAEVNRNISLDIRFVLWYLDAVEGARARPILVELGGAGAVR